MSQASRIPPAIWEAQRPRITELYVNQDKTLDEVIQIMAESGFHATKPQYIRKVNVNWKLQKNYTKEKWQLASALVTKRQADGKITQLSIDGKVISEKRRKKELSRYHVSQVEEEFDTTNTSGVVACTPPSSNSRIVLTNGLPWLKFRESFNNLIKSQPPPFDPNQQNASSGFWGLPDPLLSGVRTTWKMATGSLPLPLPPRPVSEDLSKHIDIKGQRPFELVPMSDNSMEVLGHQEPPWLQIFNSLVFLCSNNLMETESSAYELLQVAISSGFLIKMKHLFTMSSPTLEIFARHLLFVTLRVKASKETEFLRFLLESGVSPDSTDPNEYGCSAVQKATRVRNWDAVKLLLRSGADPNGKVEGTEDNTFDTPLNYALSQGGDREIAKMLIESGANVNLGFVKPLILATRKGDLVLVKHMLEAGAKLKMPPAELFSLLYFAILNQELSLVNILIEKGMSPNLMIDKLDDKDVQFLNHEFLFYYHGTSILRFAVFFGNAGIVKRLIEGGAVLDIFNDAETLKRMIGPLPSRSAILTPLQGSVQEREPEITKILLNAGAGVNFRHPATGTTLQLLCSSPMKEGDKIELAKFLLEKGADINSPPGEDAGRTAMQAAAESGHHELLKLLFTRGGNPFASAAKENGLTVFQAALRSRSVELVTYVFWELGSSCSCFSFFYGTNYLEEAVSTGNLQLLETVLKFWNHHELHWPKEFISSALKTAVRRHFIHHIIGPDAEPFTTSPFTIPEEDISSLICESIWYCSMRTFDLLMQRFIKPNLDCVQPGYPTPLWLAIHQGRHDIVESLLNAGANPNKPSLVVCNTFYKKCCDDTGPEMPLKQAICRFNSRIIELLTGKGANIHCLIDCRLTPLLVSLQRRRENAAVILLSKGADPNEVDISGKYTALGFALDRNVSLSTVQLLIQRGADVNMPSAWGTPLEQVARGGPRQQDTMQRCQLLLAAGADVNAYIQSTALESAVANNDMKLAKLFIEAGANVNDSTFGETVLQREVQKSNTDLVKLLVKAGADVNAFSTGTSALGLAVSNNNLELAVLFLAKGVDVNDSTLGDTVLQRAASLGNLKIVKHLIDRGADFDAKVPGSFATALQYAAVNGSVEIVKHLVERGASVNEEASPYYKMTALELAIDRGHTEAAIYLIEKGASIHKCPTTDGETTFLQLAAKRGDYDMVTYLVEKGAAVNAAPATKRGATALQFAAINGNIKMAILLLENGAHVNAKGAEAEGRTALEGAAEHGRLDMIYFLLENDKEPDTIEERCCHAAEFAEAEHHDVIARILRNYKKP
ncbi:hypothetical protein FANTH_1699 [Fusarium anthophilum]|uniref:Clr5 domain-containing protein n=1 Tax=Fusarium anthophilum TaxID=48485 RepID=A0A8H4ZW21_9HYPO|nr:hypothetical protein FANTH_1699 [Fusarium anthophilum]